MLMGSTLKVPRVINVKIGNSFGELK